jgi:hypothetical protein
MTKAFDTELTIVGPLRSPAQMLAHQEYDGHASVHDDAMAEKLGLIGAPIEGPTHFSQFDPIAVSLWGHEWFERGCISAHFENMVIEGEQVQASAVQLTHDLAKIRAVKADGTPVLSGTITLGPVHPTTELDGRLAASREPGELFIIDQLFVGQKSRNVTASMAFNEHNGNLYPFSLADKLRHITEPSPWYNPETASASPWHAAIIPFEMASVLAAKCPHAGEVRGPAVGLFMDLEIRMINGPFFIDHEYSMEREVVLLGQTKRVEYYYTRTTISEPSTGKPVCEVLLNQGVFKASFAAYPGN